MAGGSTKLNGRSTDSALHASRGPSGSPVITTHIEWERLMGELSDYRYWQLKTVIGRIQVEHGVGFVRKVGR